MPASLADALFQRLIDAFPPIRAYAPSDFAREPMPPAVAHYLTMVLRRLVRLEAERLELNPGSAWFDAGHTEVERARRAFVQTLAAHGRFPAAEWQAPLRQATTQVTAYLVRPVATLTSFVFQDGDDPAAAAVVERRLSYFTGHTYLLDGARLFFRQKQVPEVRRHRFEEVLRHLDQRLTRDYKADAWLRLLAPLFDLARHARPEAPGLPVPLLRAFFEDKQAADAVRRLEAASAEVLDEEGLRQVLETPVERPVWPAPAPPPDAPPPAAPAPAASPADDSPNSAEPLWKQFQRTSPAPVEAAGNSARPDGAPRHAQLAPAPDTRPRWMQFRTDSAAPPPERAVAPTPTTTAPTTTAPTTTAAPKPTAPKRPTDLAALEQTVLGKAAARNRDLFVRHLFSGSEVDYAAVLQRLSSIVDWGTATQVIADEVFRKHQVNIYSDPAVLFTDAVEAQMRREA